MLQSASKSEGLVFSNSTPSLVLKEKRDRLMKIEQKLEAITAHKQNQAREQTQEDLTKRVLDAELRCSEEIKRMDGRARELRESLSQMKIRQSELTKKCELTRKNRAAQIRDLHKKLASFMAFESRERKEVENSLFSIAEKKDKQLNSELMRVKETRIEVLNNFQCSLVEELPELAAHIQQSSGEMQVKLQTLHQQVKTEALTLRESMQRQQQQQQKGIRGVQEMISRLSQQIKSDIVEQRKRREGSGRKLLALFESACGKLNLF